MNRRELHPPESTRPRRVLVVDDNEDGREPLMNWLQGQGYEVRAARDGFDALAVAASFTPEVILMDIGMPQMDGYEVCSRLRATERGRYVLIYAMTGFSSEAHRRSAARAGFDGYYVKPLDLRMLSKALEKRL